MRKYARQMRLAEVGQLGQEALGRIDARISTDGDPAWVATRYLLRAGVRSVSPSEPDASHALVPEEQEVRLFLEALSPAARTWACGAHEALVVLRRGLGAR